MTIYDMGYRIIENPEMTCQKQVRRQRSLSQRLFTFPWRPFQKTELILMTVPDDRMVIQNNTLMVHPEVYKKLKAVKRKNNEKD